MSIKDRRVLAVYLDDNDNAVLDWTDADSDNAWDPGEGERWLRRGLGGHNGPGWPSRPSPLV